MQNQKQREILKAQTEEQIEKQFLSGKKDEDFGVYCDLFSAKTGIKGQDGGVVTTLLQKGLTEKLFDVAIVVRRREGYSAEAVVAENAEAVLAARGTIYLKIGVTAKLRELITKGKRRIAIVCTPCEVRVTRRIQQTIGKDCEVTVIGLFCFEAFNRQKLKEQMQIRLGVNLDVCGKTEVKKGKFTVQNMDQEVNCSVKDLNCAAEGCRLCDDFTSRLADVSVGSAGSKSGYSTVIVRSKVGEKLVENLDCTRETANKVEVTRLSMFKRKRVKRVPIR